MNDQILQEISEFCRSRGLAESTFGRRAVNDGKLASRLRNGGRITTDTLERIRNFMARSADARRRPPHAVRGATVLGACRWSHRRRRRLPRDRRATTRSRNFRFFDNRQKYLLFVNTCSEKWEIANRVGMELASIHPRPPAVRVFDAGVGDGTVLVARDAHDARPFPDHAVLHRRQGNQPRRHPPDAAENGRPLHRAPLDRRRAHQPCLRRGAVAAR